VLVIFGVGRRKCHTSAVTPRAATVRRYGSGVGLAR
jgi:hypothetical protein